MPRTLQEIAADLAAVVADDESTSALIASNTKRAAALSREAADAAALELADLAGRVSALEKLIQG